MYTIEHEQVETDAIFPDWGVHITPQMANELGALSIGVLSEFITLATTRSLRIYQQKASMVDQIDLNYFRLVQIDHDLEIHLNVVNENRRLATFDVDMISDHTLVAKALVTCQIIEEI